MKKYIRNIALVFTLLLLGGMVNEACAVVTYHILTLPLNSSTNNTKADYNGVRLEALRCTSNDLTVGLPEDYKSPLATGFTYYAASQVTKSPSRVKIYANNNTSFDTYTIAVSPTTLSEGDAIADGSDIYVTYSYNSSNGIVDLTGATEYNIQIGDRFLAFNGDRGNRPGSILKSEVTASQLVSDEFTYITNGVNYNHNFYFKWKFLGSDPYNIVVATAYTGSGTYTEGNQKEKAYAESSLYAQLSTGGSVNKIWLSNETDRQWSNSVAGTYTSKPGFYRSMNPVFTSFVLLNHKTENYTLVGSVVNTNGNNWQPNTSGQYMHLMNNNNIDPEILTRDATAADQIQFWPIETYTFKVNTPLTGTDVTATTEYSSYTRVNEPTKQIMTSEVPSSLRRKYCSFTYFYKEAAKTNQITTYAQAYDNSKVIYVDYTVSGLPFQTSTNYTTAKWYNIKKYSASAFLGFNTSDNKVYSNGSNTATDTKNQFAFIGDPYELRIINRYESTKNSANYYAGFSSDAADQQMTVAASPTVYTWEIEYETRTTDFLLRSFNRGTPLYWNWEGSGTTVVSYKTAGSKVVVSELPQYTYTYHIIRSGGTEAINASISQDATIQLSLATLPSIIVSPYLVGETLTFYSDEDCNTTITEAPSTNNAHIYVKYTTTAVSSKTVKLNSTDEFNVKLNGEYIYWDTGTNALKTTATLADAADSYCLWRLEGGDPYAMKIYNKGLAKYVKATFSDAQALAFDTEANASLFIAKLNGSIIGEYEVMAATGSGTDASTTYYNIGRSATDGVKIYSNSSYAHGTAQLKFILEQTRVITYHLIDKSKTELLSVTSKSPELHLPSEYVSPLVATYHYFESKPNADAGTSEITTMPSGSGNIDIYVNYDVNSLVKFNDNASPYLLQFHNGSSYYLEDGNDGLETTLIQAVYPYCNGDANFYIYGQEKNTEQMNGGSSTRVRWAWYLESDYNDPYHVKIHSKINAATYGGVGHKAYFRTFAVHYNQDVSAETYHIVTGVTMPGASEVPATEYMILGSEGNYLLTTTYKVDSNNDGDTDDAEDMRQTVTSFEQYWKTYDTIKKKVLESSEEDDENGSITVPDDEALTKGDYQYRTYLSTVEGWHSYDAWANAKRWNGYNADGKTSKGVEKTEHWFQTIKMGDGTFNFVSADIPPVLVLLDRHGWEIMRKPLPTSTNDPDKEAKYAALRAYDSPMVEAYQFWSSASKASGAHKYYKLSKAITKSATDNAQYTSTSLASLPPITAQNVRDTYGDIQDQYVTYTVKEEYENSYTYTLSTNEGDKTFDETGSTASSFLVLQNGDYAEDVSSTLTAQDIPSGGVSKMIIDADGSIDATKLWYVQPNLDIDEEMGITWGTSDDITAAEPLSKYATKVKYGSETSTGLYTGFDPYNLQIKNVSTGKFFTTDLTATTLSGGAMSGTYTSGTVTLADAASSYVNSESYDHTTLKVTNQTFMAVQDENGNMQLMPRFDHSRRINAFATMATPLTAAEGDQTGAQTTFMLRPLVYEYIIVDNQGRESLRYKAGGEFYPGIPAHFKSPLATDFKYYSAATEDTDKTITDAGYYTITESTEETTSEDEITGSFAAAGLTNSTNTVYVRYSYDEVYDTDHDLLLQGPWLTMSLGGKDVQADGTVTTSVTDVKLYTGSKDATKNEWQWKFLRTPCTGDANYVAPDPYAVELFNRKANYGESDLEDRGKYLFNKHFVLLSHSSGDYALAEAGTGSTTAYNFLNGASMTAPSTTAASIENEASFSPSSNTISAGARIIVTNEVTHAYTYKVITNSGVLAVTATQDNEEAVSNGFVPTVPYAAQSPLLNISDYSYYGTVRKEGGTYEVVPDYQLATLYGIYNDDEVYVRYDYNADTSPFRVPNVKGTVDSHVTKGTGSNDSPLDIGGDLSYNIIWYYDNMMYNSSGTVSDGGSLSLNGADTHKWKFTSGDPYALNIYSAESGTNVYLDGTSTLTEEAYAGSFMLLRKEDYDYGILQVTGTTGANAGKKLTDYGESLTPDANTAPTRYVIFALATHDLIYHLRNPLSGGSSISISYRETVSGSTAGTVTVPVTTKRTSSISDVHAGTVSLGDALAVPYAMKRPYCSYTYYISDVKKKNGSGDYVSDNDLNNKYQWLKLTDLPNANDLIDTEVYVDVVYSYNTDDDFENQDDYKANPYFRFESGDASTTQWFTAESRSTTPFLVNYKYSTAIVGASAGRDQHCTNDHLWAVEGDPYGFYMHNRYCTKNNNAWNEVMTTSAAPAADAQMTMSTTTTYAVYEMIPTSTDGYFRLHPLSGAAGLYVWGTLEEGVPVGKLSLTNSTDWIFNLTTTQLEPYYTRKGYVGGLNETGVTNYENASTLKDKQAVVYNDVNIVGYASGYYRLHSIPSTSINPVRYASGYTHETEKTGGAGDTAIPLHFYEREGTSTTFTDLYTGFTSTNATRGDIPIPAVEYDPASIFYFSTSPSTIKTQGLFVNQNKMDASSGTSFTVEDIGSAVVTLRNGTLAAGYYLNYNQSSDIYDLKYTTGEMQDYTKWCMQPANNAGLMLTLNSGGDNYYYATFCAPYDVTLPSTATAYVCTTWNTDVIYPKSISQTITAGTPAIIRSSVAGPLKMTLPGTATSATSCVFTGKYLEQLLTTEITESDKVFTFGLPITGISLTTTSGTSNGVITGIYNMSQSSTGVGFYLNANPNKEANESEALWTRNNRYVKSNKIYYRADSSGASAPSKRAIEFVPVIFDDEEGDEEISDKTEQVLDGRVYNLQGRCVATEEQVKDGTWQDGLEPGIYIVNGKKLVITRK